MFFLFPRLSGARVGWELFAYRFNEFPRDEHAAVWEHHLAPLIAWSWRSRAETALPLWEARLAEYSHAFPRGRIVRRGSIFLVCWGGEPLGPFCVSKAQIERAFGIVGKARWKIDERESCQADDARAVTALLKITPFWGAAV